MAIQFVFMTILICFTLAGAVGCTSHRGLEGLKAQQRHELYKRCVDAQMKQATFGNGMAVHQACLTWAQSQM